MFMIQSLATVTVNELFDYPLLSTLLAIKAGLLFYIDCLGSVYTRKWLTYKKVADVIIIHYSVYM